jgi:hypothetical protein
MCHLSKVLEFYALKIFINAHNRVHLVIHLHFVCTVQQDELQVLLTDLKCWECVLGAEAMLQDYALPTYSSKKNCSLKNRRNAMK